EVLVSQRLVEILNCLTNFNRRWPFEETAVETYRVAGLYIVQNQDVPDYWMVALEGREFLPTLEEPAPRFFPFLEGGRHRHPVYAVRQSQSHDAPDVSRFHGVTETNSRRASLR